MFPLINDNKIATSVSSSSSLSAREDSPINNTIYHQENHHKHSMNGFSNSTELPDISNPNNMLFPNGKLFQSKMIMAAGPLNGTNNMVSSTSATSTISFNEEEQHFYNQHIIENFVESVREMNDTVLIPSKLKDLDPSPPPSSSNTATSSNGGVLALLDNVSTNKIASLNDDLYSYYQMINVVKNDLFEPHSDFDSKKLFQIPKRKISRPYNRPPSSSSASGTNIHQNSTNNGNNSNNTNNNGLSNSRSVSTTSLSSMNGNANCNGRHSPSSSDVSNESDMNGELVPSTTATTLATAPLSSEQLIGQNAKQLTVQFIHHLHSLYAILEHFTHAADFITERYINEFESTI